MEESNLFKIIGQIFLFLLKEIIWLLIGFILGFFSAFYAMKLRKTLVSIYILMMGLFQAIISLILCAGLILVGLEFEIRVTALIILNLIISCLIFIRTYRLIPGDTDNKSEKIKQDNYIEQVDQN